MKSKLYFSIFLISLFFSVCEKGNAQAPNWEWAKSAGGSDYDYASSVTNDALGNIIVAGYFRSSTITFGSTTLTNSSAGFTDLFIVKYDATGSVLWAKSVGGSYNDAASSVTADQWGNIVVTGSFQSTSINFDTTTLTNLNAFVSADSYIAKYDLTGNVLWAKSLGGVDDDQAESVTVDASGNVIVTGIFRSPILIFGVDTLTNAGSFDMFLVKYDANGNLLWEKSAGGFGYEGAASVTADAFGCIIVTGSFQSPTINFDTTTFINAGTEDIFVTKYDSLGNVLWAKSAGGNSDDVAYSVTEDLFGNIIVAGYFKSSAITFGATTLTNAGNVDVFIVKYDTSGSVIWAKSEGGNGYDEAKSVTSDVTGNLIVAGYFTSPTITFASTSLTNTGFIDMFVAKYDATGTVLWAKSTVGNDSDVPNSIIADAYGNIVVTGFFASTTISFDSIALTNMGSSDLFLARLEVTTGIESIDQTNNTSLFPNPTNDLFTINLPSATNKKITITITNLTGKIIYTTTSTAKQKIEVSTKDFSNGIYFVQIQTPDYNETKKLVVAK